MLQIGHPDEENYDAEIEAAKPMTTISPILMNTADPQFKENLALAKHRNQVTIEDSKVDTSMYDLLAAILGKALRLLFMKSPWAKYKNQHTFVELYAYYRLDILRVCPSSIEAIKAAAVYDPNLTYDENMAILLTIIEALQPYDITTQYQQMKMMKEMTKGEPAVRRAYANYLQQNVCQNDCNYSGRCN